MSTQRSGDALAATAVVSAIGVAEPCVFVVSHDVISAPRVCRVASAVQKTNGSNFHFDGAFPKRATYLAHTQRAERRN